MAPLTSIVFIFVALGMHAASVNIVATEKSEGLVRRESTQVGLDPSGHVVKLNQMLRAENRGLQKDITECDRQFLLMAEGENKCKGSGTFLEMTDAICQFASKRLLGHAVTAESPGYFLNNSENSTLPHPKYCFIDSEVQAMHYNPLESTGESLTGRKVCLRATYINGSKETDSSSGCADDAKPILDYDECWHASSCAGGGEVCRTPEFQENRTTALTDKPQGCFKNAIDHPTLPGCWSYNPAKPTGAVTGATPVCENTISDANKFVASR